jgi:hypothetical protein
MTRDRLIAKALVLLDPPPRDRERYRADLERALGRFAAHKASRRPSPKLAKAHRDRFNRFRKVNAQFVAEGGDDGGVKEALDHGSIRMDRTWDLLLGWGRKASKTQGGVWDRLSGLILRGAGKPSLFQQLRKLRHAYPDPTVGSAAWEFDFVFEVELAKKDIKIPPFPISDFYRTIIERMSRKWPGHRDLFPGDPSRGSRH